MSSGKRIRAAGLAGLVALAFGGIAPAMPAGAPAPAASARPRYEYRRIHHPDGIGKFYMGREIAQVMGHLAADWLDRPEREAEEQPSKLLDALNLRPGDHVADVGAGTGYFTFRLAERVGPTGRVYAVDIQPEMLAILRRRMAERRTPQVRPVLGTLTDPKLPAESLDLILLVDVYHELSHPWEMTQAMVRALKPGGRLVLVEYRAEDPSVPIKPLHKMSEAQIRRELSVHPVRWAGTLEILPWQHIVVFRK